MSGLFWRVFAVNACFLALVALLLIVTPVTISAPIAVTEAALVLLGLAIALLVNAVLLRRVFTPLERLVRRMATAPSPIQQFAFDLPNDLVGAFPMILIPIYLVPLSVLLHFASLTKLRRTAQHVEFQDAPACSLRKMQTG